MNSQPLLGSSTTVAAPVEAEVPADIAWVVEEIRKVHADSLVLPAERTLADRIKVKRHTLRRALEFLREHGEIQQTRPRSRRRSAETKHEDLVNMTNPIEVAELRRMIEPVLAKLAAMRATPSDIAAMQKELETGGKPGGTDVHRMIAQATGNVLAAEIYNLLRRIEGDARLGTASSRPPGGDTAAKQRALVEAIAARAPDRASEAMSETLASLYRQTLFDLE